MSTTGKHLRPVDASTVVLAIETSCDETAASLVMGGVDVLSSVVSSQIDLHAQYGGVVPEIAGRAHLDLLNPVVARAIVESGVDETRIDAVAATHGPGLIGALLVGVSAAKSLALTWDVPYVGVNHLEAHLYAGLLEKPELELPLVVLLVSGGHTMLIEMRNHGEYRLLGRTIDDAAGEIVYKKYFNLGFAADTPNGLVVPVIKNADQKSILEISKEILDLSKRARDGKLKPDEMKGATITITNIGSIGGTYATPVINHPEVAILGMYKIDEKPVIKNGQLAAIKVMNYTVTADHRLIDGAVAARFLAAFIARIENPGKLLVELI